MFKLPNHAHLPTIPKTLHALREMTSAQESLSLNPSPTLTSRLGPGFSAGDCGSNLMRCDQTYMPRHCSA